jgi:thiamine pyrophosphate-dependent acetolactate synthase large subunit-like protein
VTGNDPTAGRALFERLGRLGVDVVLVNSGTDFPPVIEGLAEVESVAANGGAAGDTGGAVGSDQAAAPRLPRAGYAAKRDEIPLTSLAPSPDFALVALASRANVETVENPADLPAALDRAVRSVIVDQRQALVNVIIAP